MVAIGIIMTLPQLLSRDSASTLSPNIEIDGSDTILSTYRTLSTRNQERGRQENLDPLLECYESQSSHPASQIKKLPQYWTKFRHLQETIRKLWLWETGACILALACLCTISTVLATQNGKELNGWSWSIPPGAVVSFIGTLSKGSMALALAQVISQLKWLHYLESKSLSHLRYFDSCSRGPIGSIVLIWTSGRLLASIAALLMILTVLFDPFVQLVFSFPVQTVEDSNETAHFATTRVYNGMPNFEPNAIRLEQKLWSSIYKALGEGGLRMTAACSTGECTWRRTEPITTLGVCGSCTDVTSTTQRSCEEWTDPDELETANTTCTYTFPGRETLQASAWHMVDQDVYRGPSAMITYSTLWNSALSQAILPRWIPNIELMIYREPWWYDNLNSNELDSSDNLSPPPRTEVAESHRVSDGTIIRFNVIQTPLLQNRSEKTLAPARCWSCGLYWCERSYDGITVQNGDVRTESEKTERLWIAARERFLFGGDLFNRFSHEKVILFRGDELVKMISSDNSSSIAKYRARIGDDGFGTHLLSLFKSYYTNRPLYRFRDHESSYGKYDLSENPATISALVYAEDLDVTIKRLAFTLSEHIRNDANELDHIRGQALRSGTFISVRWEWLALPFTLIVLTCILLPIVAVESHRKGVAIWKDDPLALLFHHVEGLGSLSSDGKHKTSTRDLSNLADEIDISLSENHDMAFVRSLGGRRSRSSWWWSRDPREIWKNS